MQGADGNFYGTTSSGGFANCTDGCGTIFKITPSGTLTTLYRFCAQSNCPDGYNPWGLMQARDGNFYGTTGHGGASGNSCAEFGCGTIFKITPSGTLTTLYSFCPNGGCRLEAPDGQAPMAIFCKPMTATFTEPLRRRSQPGRSDCAEFGCGTVFKITPSGTLTTLYSFCSETNCADGSSPYRAAGAGHRWQFLRYHLRRRRPPYCDFGRDHLQNHPQWRLLTTLYSFCSRGADGSQPDAALGAGPQRQLLRGTSQGGTSHDGTSSVSPCHAHVRLVRMSSEAALRVARAIRA